MKRFLVGVILLTVFSCGGDNSSNEGESGDVDTIDNIVEYELDEDRISAVEFNNELTLMQEDMLNVIGVLFQSDSTNAKTNYDNALFEVQINQDDLKKLKFDGSEKAFKAEMKNLLNFYLDELQGEFKSILPLLEKGQLTEEENQILIDYDKRFAHEEKAIFMKVIEEQDKFAESHNIKLVDQ